MGKLSNLKPTPRLRGRAGQKLRTRRLQRTNYLCEDCKAVGRITLATVVDHIVPLAHGGPDTDENTRNLCDEHNLKRTAEQFALRAPNQKIGIDGRPSDPSHPWNR
jgi:5-methylcytosine-specific restriction enzyme A